MAYEHRREQNRQALLDEIAAKLPGEIGMLAQVILYMSD